MRSLVAVAGPILLSLLILLTFGCNSPVEQREVASPQRPDYYGTLEPFAAEAIYFVLTDRFVNGDPSNDHRDQGGRNPTFDRPLPECDGVAGNVGYLGGDFRGLVEQAEYIAEMGFTTVWITPIADNPDQAFTGGEPITCDSILTDHGKAGYHGYWAVNFYRTDEHLVSDGLDFSELTVALGKQGLKTMLDIVANHGSPGWTMPEPQAGFGWIVDGNGELLADHSNLPPRALDPKDNPLHHFFRTEPSLAELASLDPHNPEVVDYLAGAYLRWIEQGADAFRIDTMAYMPHEFWIEIGERIRSRYPYFYMVGEVFSDDPADLTPWTLAENGGFSVLDFPLQARLREVFESPDGDYARLAERLYLDESPYRNAYELVTFYDNHDMHRLGAEDEGFINIHNFLFTSRGIPAVYYGSEMGFMRGRREHAGNRNYFGLEGIEAARQHPIRDHLGRITQVRRESIALQKGRQVMLELAGDRAAFYRVYQHGGISQTALVLLNKGSAATRFDLVYGVQAGTWYSPLDGQFRLVEAGQGLRETVGANGVQVLLLDEPINEPTLQGLLDSPAISGR